jgi:hypothetical protein
VTIPTAEESHKISMVGYHDLAGRPAFKLALRRDGARWLLYTGHLWHSGWSVIDVTEPTRPKLLRFVESPYTTQTSQIQVAGDFMITGLQRYPHQDRPFPSDVGGALVWDLREDPINPELVGQYRVGGIGTHRNFYAGGRYLYAAIRGNEALGSGALAIVDLEDPSAPREVSRWSEVSTKGTVPFFHGPAYVVGDRAYCSCEDFVVLDVSDPKHPVSIARLGLGGLSGALGVHSAIPYLGGRFAVINGEAYREGQNYEFTPVVLVDLADESKPSPISVFPVPRPSLDGAHDSYVKKGGRFGAHNQHQHQGHPDLLEPTSLVAMTYFNAGLRIFSIADPLYPVEVASFVATAPERRRGPRPRSALVSHFEDVLIDSRQNIYCSDANHGIFVLRYDEKLDPIVA